MSSGVRLRFTKGNGKYDLMEVVRPDGAVERIDCPKQGIIPHDMVHYAVEDTLRLRGFIGRVAGGETASFRMAAEAESDGVERLVEVMQGDGWSGGTTPAAEMIDLYRVTCEARGCPMLPVDEADIAAVRERIATLTEAWTAVPVGKAIELSVA
ncbi:hypothetical protein [Sphingomonas lacunae]|uniref:hypothetical protein n=1 Tax=Sphingomonas lacunae TaxID=2698828 RepID=UPI001BB024E4|nr:hypothetical protein [Sphingomonas lacunae]